MVISTDYSQNWRFVNEQVLFYLFNVVFSLIFFIIIHYFFLFFIHLFLVQMKLFRLAHIAPTTD